MSTDHYFDHRVTADHTVERSQRPVLSGPNKLKLGIFGANASGGNGSMTFAENQIQLGHWSEVRDIAKKADSLGIEAFIPIARWKGVAGPGRHWDRLYETFTWAAGLAEATERIQIFSTTHVPFYHPVLAAKLMATVDHVSGGRMGLNIVAGYHPTEHAMFGTPLREHDERYLVADEWIRILKRLWTEEDEYEFDFDGEYYKLAGAESAPKPVQSPYPVIMSAGTSPAGRHFAFEHADLLFLGVQDVDDAAAVTSELRADADRAGREDLALWTMTHVICRDTEKEALDYAKYVWEEKGDFDSAATMVKTLGGGDVRSFADFKQNQMLLSVLRTGNAVPIVGSVEQVVEKYQKLSDAGINGVTVAMIDYDDALDRFDKQVLPMMRSAGLRADS